MTAGRRRGESVLLAAGEVEAPRPPHRHRRHQHGLGGLLRRGHTAVAQARFHETLVGPREADWDTLRLAAEAEVDFWNLEVGVEAEVRDE